MYALITPPWHTIQTSPSGCAVRTSSTASIDPAAGRRDTGSEFGARTNTGSWNRIRAGISGCSVSSSSNSFSSQSPACHSARSSR